MELNVQGLEHATNATSVCVGMVAMATPASAATPHAAEEEPTQPCVLVSCCCGGELSFVCV